MAGRVLAAERRLHAGVRENAILALLCLGAGVVPLAARSIGGDVARVAYGALVAAAYLAFALFARRTAALRPYWELSFAFFIFAFVQVLNNAVPGYVASHVVRAPATAGDPLAATVSGTVVIQLLETGIAIVPIIAFTLVSGRDLGAIYARVGKRGWFVGALVFFAAFYGYLATIALRPDSPAHRLLPTNGPLTLARFLALTPALLVVAVSNGFEEEFLFRGLFLQKYTAFFGAGVANVLQAALFATAHAWITYTPTALLFIVALVFPLGLLAGYLVRATNGVVVPAIVHAALDLAIYLAFLTYAV
ncbi:MAG TPA: CPBP family intramembrane glutamic endopeptidase [Thermomicrobiales bacterium]|nr:CPBP family intramembrane glutamic endopeptidase [Thermomicrobiales bacterium]